MTTSYTRHFAAQAARGLCGENLDAQKHQDDWMVFMVSVNCPVAK